MPHPITDALHRVIHHALALHAALERGERRDLDQEQSRLVNLAMDVPSGEEGSGDRGARYAVVCWLDELFTRRSAWADRWNEQKLESSLYGSNDRAWEFWRQARLAEARPTDEVLAAYFQCVALGFRGQYEDDPQKLGQWFERTRARVTRVPSGAEDGALKLRRTRPAPRLYGAARVRRLAAVAAVATLCLTPLATFALIQRLIG